MTGGKWTSGVSAPYKWTVIAFLNTSVPLWFNDGDNRSTFNFIPPWLQAGNYKILIYSALKGKAGRTAMNSKAESFSINTLLHQNAKR